jgi:outer membrane immunogenic protein
MRAFRTVSIAALATLASATAALAADPIAYPTSAAPQAALPIYDDDGFDWNGFYAGVHGSAQLDGSDTRAGAGFDLGFNAALDLFLVGAEFSLNGLSDGTDLTAYAQVLGRAGVIVTNDVLAYGAAGYGTDLGGTDDHVLLGGGLEFAVTDDVSLRGQYLYGLPVTGDATQQVTLGASFHF